MKRVFCLLQNLILYNIAVSNVFFYCFVLFVISKMLTFIFTIFLPFYFPFANHFWTIFRAFCLNFSLKHFRYITVSIHLFLLMCFVLEIVFMVKIYQIAISLSLIKTNKTARFFLFNLFFFKFINASNGNSHLFVFILIHKLIPFRIFDWIVRTNESVFFLFPILSVFRWFALVNVD